MDFAKRSNLSSLLAAVLVGLLSLQINQVFKTNPEAVDRVLRQLTESLFAEAPPADVPPEDRLSPELVSAIENLDQRLARMYQIWKSVRLTSENSRVPHQVGQSARAIQASLTELEKRDDVSEEQWRRARMLALSAFFVSAEILPDEFSQAFQDHCEQLLAENLTSDQRKKVTLLRFYHQMQVSQSNGEGLLARLRGFSRAHPTADVGVPLYLVIAQDLASQGRAPLAKKVLKQGMSVYHGQPEAGHLVNELINLNL
jgi:hypothetical protein